MLAITKLLTLMAVVLLCAPRLPGASIKIVPASGVGATDLKSLVRSVTAGCSSDQDKMEALWAFIVSAWEGQNPLLTGDGFSERAAGISSRDVWRVSTRRASSV